MDPVPRRKMLCYLAWEELRKLTLEKIDLLSTDRGWKPLWSQCTLRLWSCLEAMTGASRNSHNGWQRCCQ